MGAVLIIMIPTFLTGVWVGVKMKEIKQWLSQWRDDYFGDGSL